MRTVTTSTFLLVLFAATSAPANAQEHYTNCLAHSGNNATLVIDASGIHTIDDGVFLPGDEIGVFTEDGLCIGSKVWTGANLAITIWGDDPFDAEKIGLFAGEQFMYRVWSKAQEREYGASEGAVSIAMYPHPPFRVDRLYYPDALYRTNQIEAISLVASQKNEIRVGSPHQVASESGESNIGSFNITRDEPLIDSVVVHYRLSGSAENGQDYAPVDSSVVLAPGERSAYVIIDPLSDFEQEVTETVELHVIESDDYYVVTDSSSAMLTIEDAGSTVGREEEIDVRMSRALSAPYPNPISSVATVGFRSDEAGVVDVALFDLLGRRVSEIYSGAVGAGVEYAFDISVVDLPNGVYLVKAIGLSSLLVRSVVVRR